VIWQAPSPRQMSAVCAMLPYKVIREATAEDWPGLPVGPWFSLGQELGELRVEHAELVVPRVAYDPELEAAFVLMVPPAGAQRFKALDLGRENPVIRPGRLVGVAPRPSSYLLSDAAARLLEARAS
jgi:hypothetical protein